MTTSAAAGSLAGQVVLVTGSAGHLGRAVVAAVRAAGGRLVLADRAPDRLARLFPDLAEDGDHWLAGGIDLADADAVAAFAAAAEARLGRIDVAVHTVGGFTCGPRLEDGPLADWSAMWSVNLETALHVCRAVLPGMRRRGHGRIVTVAAGAGLAAAAGFGPYAAAKAALMRLTEAVANEGKADGLTANCVLPGIIDTPPNRAAMPKADPSGWVTPAAIADVIVFLAGPGSRAVTGANIPVMGRG